MKAGYVIVVGTICYFVLDLIESLWVFQYKLPTIFYSVTLLACILWLKKKDNRRNFRQAVFSNQNKVPGTLLDKLSNSIRIGIISGFALLTILFETTHIVMSKSSGYEFIKNEIQNNSMVLERIGKVKLVAFKRSMHFSQSFKGDGQKLETNLLVFGDSEKVRLKVFAFKKSAFWEIEKVSFVD